MLVVRVAARAAAALTVEAAQPAVDLEALLEASEDGGDVDERSQRPEHDLAQRGRGLLQLGDRVSHESVDAPGLIGQDVSDLGEAGGETREVLQRRTELRLEAPLDLVQPLSQPPALARE